MSNSETHLRCKIAISSAFSECFEACQDDPPRHQTECCSWKPSDATIASHKPNTQNSRGLSLESSSLVSTSLRQEILEDTTPFSLKEFTWIFSCTDSAIRESINFCKVICCSTQPEQHRRSLADPKGPGMALFLSARVQTSGT